MRKLVLFLGVAAFLLPVCLTSCQKEEIQPYEEELNITKASWYYIDFHTSVNHGFITVHVTGWVDLGPNGEVLGGHLFFTPVTNDPDNPMQTGTYFYSFDNHQLQDPDGNVISMEEVFPGLMDAIENYIQELVNE